MTVSTIDESQRKAARVAGFAYLFTFVIVVLVNFGIHERLMVAGNAAETARNILAHERLFRIGVAGDLVYEAGLVVLLSALYVILKPVGRTLALLERLVYASMWVLMSLNLLNCAEAVERCRLPAGAWNRSIPDFGEAVSLRFRRLLRWPAFLWIGIHRLQLLVLQVGLYPERIGWLRCHRLRLGRRVYSRLHHFSCLRQGREPVAVRFRTGDFRTGDRFLARIQRIEARHSRA